MGAICGWMARDTRQEDGELLLRAMLDSQSNNTSSTDVIAFASSAAAARASVVPASVYTAGNILVALEGRVHWASGDLAAIARQRGDGAAVAEAYRRHDVACPSYIGGAFAIAVLDPEKATVLLAIDRAGIRTLCFASPDNGLVFGSNAEIVSTHPDVGHRLSPQAIFNYLYCHVVPSPGTVYANISKLLPGECAIFKNGAIQRRLYWRLHYTDAGAGNFGALRSRFRHLLRDAATRAVDNDANVGAFLSGGTDSSTVTGLLTELRGKPVKTYSIGFAEKGFDEIGYARITASHFATEAHEYYVKPEDIVDAIPRIARAYDEPFGNESAVPTYFCARMAHADGIRVMLAGDGGDEIFGGNARYAKQKIFEWYRTIPTPLQRLITPLAERLSIPKFSSYVRQASIPLPDRLESYNFLHRSPLSDILEPDFLAQVNVSEPLRLMREAYERAESSSPVNRMMHLDLKLTLADNDLRKVSRMCELAGVEARFPLLDDTLVEFSGQLPPSLKVRGLQLRYFFKRALSDFLPTETIAKKKHGFGMPFGIWLRSYQPLTELVHESVGAFQRRGILRPEYLKELMLQQQSGHASYFGVMIWVIVMLERWLAAREL